MTISTDLKSKDTIRFSPIQHGKAWYVFMSIFALLCTTVFFVAGLALYEFDPTRFQVYAIAYVLGFAGIWGITFANSGRFVLISVLLFILGIVALIESGPALLLIFGAFYAMGMYG